jgi:pSer/pThr/pTyr-binding forkhead associated (FHA) protein
LREHTGDTPGLRRVAAVGTLADLTDEQLRAVEALPQGSALLIALRGSDRGARYLLDSDSVVAGRSPECDIFLDDITVSRQHSVFLRSEGQLTVADQGSLNGTYVNRALTDGPVVLRAGDEVQIGKFRLVFYPSPHGLG